MRQRMSGSQVPGRALRVHGQALWEMRVGMSCAPCEQRQTKLLQAANSGFGVLALLVLSALISAWAFWPRKPHE